MRVYHASGNRSLATTTNNKTVLQLKQPATALKRLALRFIELHSDATADNAYTMSIQRISAAGSGGTTPAISALDPADGTASAVVRAADTTDPTITASSEVLSLGGHQRANVQWYAPPDGEIIVPVTNNAGLVSVCTVLSAAFNQVQSFQWQE